MLRVISYPSGPSELGEIRAETLLCRRRSHVSVTVVRREKPYVNRLFTSTRPDGGPAQQLAQAQASRFNVSLRALEGLKQPPTLDASRTSHQTTKILNFCICYTPHSSGLEGHPTSRLLRAQDHAHSFQPLIHQHQNHNQLKL